jgi:hypothetical protein
MDERNWVVYDLTVGPLDRWAPTRHDEPAWGPMTEAEARAMEARNPRAYWAKQLRPPSSEPRTYTLEDLKDPATIVEVLKELRWVRVGDTHHPDCIARPTWGDSEGDEEDPAWGLNCNCVPDASTWCAPDYVYKFLGEDWDSRLAKARDRRS